MRNGLWRRVYEVQDEISGEICLSSEVTRNADGFLTQIADLDEDNPQERLSSSKFLTKETREPVAIFKSKNIEQGKIFDPLKDL